VQAYVRAHLRDSDLTPARIAASNGLSIRAMYGLYASRGVSLEQSIIEQRLDGTRVDLSAPRATERSIAQIAASWGFIDASFFARRFKARFGVTPRQWRADEQHEPTD